VNTHITSPCESLIASCFPFFLLLFSAYVRSGGAQGDAQNHLSAGRGNRGYFSRGVFCVAIFVRENSVLFFALAYHGMYADQVYFSLKASLVSLVCSSSLSASHGY
jgi:hypothetical protein